MVSRRKSNASQQARPQPRRAKTSPNVPTQPILQDLDTDRKHALIAADLAYERAHGRGAGRRVVVGDQGGQGAKHLANAGDGPQIGRRQSIRFAGPNAEPTRTRSITRREAPEYRTGEELRRHSLQSQPRHNDPSNPANDDSLLTALPEDFGESDIASVPSSYRKLRKAKSMFSPGKTPSAVFPNGIPKAGRHFQRHSQQSSDGFSEPIRAPDPRLRRSLSFLRGVTDRISTTNNGQYASQDAATQLARDTYLAQLEQQRLKEQPSFPNLGRHRTSQKAFRRTVRTSSTNSYGTAIGSLTPPVEPTKVKVLGFKARSLSQNLKTKIRRVFRRSKNDENTIPVQHLNASHAHYGNFRSTSKDWEDHYSPVPEPNAELLRRVGSRESMEHSIPIFGDKGPPPGSIRSVHSSDDDESKERSRVSSWTNSTPASTLSMPQKMERKRLSVIKEDGGPHQPSSSARRYGGLRDGYANFRQPVDQSDVDRVETERVFSALQREIEDNKRRAALDDIESGTESGSDQPQPHRSIAAPRRSSSLRRRPAPATDTVPRHAAVKPSKSWGAGEMLHQIEDGIRHRDYQQDYAELLEGLSPQEIANMNSPSTPLVKRPLREVKSAFFPLSMHIERSNTTSPFRRAMNASVQDEYGFRAGKDYANQVKTPDLFISANALPPPGSVTRSESIYSRSTGGHVASAIGSSLSLAKSQNSDDAGTAIVITKGPAKYDSSHKRESAQIDGDDVNISTLPSSIKTVDQPLGIILGNSNFQPTMHHKGSRSISFVPSPSQGAVRQNENTRTSQSFAYPYPYKSSNVGDDNDSPSSVTHQSGGLRKRSPQNSSVPQHGQKWLSTSPSLRNSPERAERLRRLKNNSTPSLRKPLSPNENQANQNPTLKNYRQELHDSDDSDVSPMMARTQVAGNQQLVNSLLRGRRSQIRIGEESGTDPAFL